MTYNLDEVLPSSTRSRKHGVEVVVDRSIVRQVDPLAAGRLDRGGARPGQGGRAHRPRRGDEAGRKARWPVDRYSQHRSVRRLAAAASRSSTRTITSRSTARSAGAHSCEGLGTQARRRPGGRSSPTAAEIPAHRAPMAVLARLRRRIPFFGSHASNAFSRDSQGISLDTSRSTSSKARHRPPDPPRRRATPGSTVPSAEGNRARVLAFQYKGLFPAIEEAAKRVSFVYRMKLSGMVDDVPCNVLHGGHGSATTPPPVKLPQNPPSTRSASWPLGPRCSASSSRSSSTAPRSTSPATSIREVRDRLKFLG